MLYPTLRHFLNPLKRTLFHPQWFIYRNEHESLKQTGSLLTGLVLDIGCADKRLKYFLPKSCEYIGLDYLKTATERYGTVPDIYADAQLLPFADSCIDSVVLLDVLEHLPDPESCLAEIARVLKPSGRFILQVPFIYPIHDAPYDFRRWTSFGLRHTVKRQGFVVIEERAFHQPAETAALIGNLALSKIAMELIARKHPGLLLLPLLALAVPWVNLLGWLLARIVPGDDFMPTGYWLVCSRSPCATSS